MRAWERMLPAVVLAVAVTGHAWGDANTDRQQQVQITLDQYAAARTPAQRAAVVDFLGHLGRKDVASGIVDHIVASRTGSEATKYDGLAGTFNPEACAAVMDRLAKADDPTVKGKMLVALRRCTGDDALKILAGSLDDKRPFRFEAHGEHPRRVCDAAYDELFLRLRKDAHYALDASPQMRGWIAEKMPVKTRDALIAKLKGKLDGKAFQSSPAPSASPSAAPAPSPAASPSPAPSALPSPVLQRVKPLTVATCVWR